MYLHKRRRSSVALCPVSPILGAMRLPSITEPALHSTWRLSYSVPDRGEELRKLSQETQSSTSSPLPNWSSIPLPSKGSTRAASPIGPRPLNRWLHSQGLRSPPQAVSTSDDGTGPHSLVSPSQNSLNGDLIDFGGVDGSSPDSGKGVHLHQMSISRRLAASRGLSSFSVSPPTSPPLSRNGSRSHLPVHSSSSSTSRRPHSITFIPLQNNIAPDTLKDTIPSFQGRTRAVQRGASPSNVSAVTSYQPSTSNSTFDLKSLRAESLGPLSMRVVTGKQF
jgi:hypothetical protein